MWILVWLSSSFLPNWFPSLNLLLIRSCLLIPSSIRQPSTHPFYPFFNLLLIPSSIRQPSISSLLSIHQPSTHPSYLSVHFPLIPIIYPSAPSTHPFYLFVNLLLIPSIYPTTFHSSFLYIPQTSSHSSFISLNILLILPLRQHSTYLSHLLTFNSSLPYLFQISTHPYPVPF